MSLAACWNWKYTVYVLSVLTLDYAAVILCEVTAYLLKRWIGNMGFCFLTKELEIRSVERGICPVIAILEFYLWFRFWPFDCHRSIILYWHAKRYPNHQHLQFCQNCDFGSPVTLIRQYLYGYLTQISSVFLHCWPTEIWPKIQIQYGGGRHLEFPKKC